MSYESAFCFGVDNPDQNMLVSEQVVAPIAENFDQGDDSSDSSVALAVAGIAGLVGGVFLFALALPFIVGAVAGAVVAPSGQRGRGAKSGALAGGFGGMIAYPILYWITGSSRFAGGVSSVTPMALGAYMGYRIHEEQEQA